MRNASSLNLSFLESAVPMVVGAGERKRQTGFSVFPAHVEALKRIGGGNASAGLAIVVSQYLERAQSEAKGGGSSAKSKASR